jgi:hypothetical protein
MIRESIGNEVEIMVIDGDAVAAGHAVECDWARITSR